MVGRMTMQPFVRDGCKLMAAPRSIMTLMEYRRERRGLGQLDKFTIGVRPQLHDKFTIGVRPQLQNFSIRPESIIGEELKMHENFLTGV
ncbi:hypothetical protein C7C56_012290 [Massilia glaciei]|uniref:Uncharacterized protein n=1 Tax=Massilia glaciei TaxID=1524097 RepID=A0A2U2HLG2_9BURK|nr:hypothetical protein C7C56_012290 [Massilia glaciei]